MHRTFARVAGRPLDASAGRHRRLVVACTAAACTAALIVAPGIGSALASPAVTTTAATAPAGTGLPAWVATATKTGPLAGSAQINLSVVLNGHDASGAEAAAIAVASPSSASYGQYLGAETYRSKYAATDAEVASVTAWLTGAGFTIASVPANHLWVRVTGTADAAKKAFGISLDGYSLNGVSLYAPAGPGSVPAAVSPLVAGVAGLSSSIRRNQPLADPGDRGDLARTLFTPRASSAARRSAATAPSAAPAVASPGRLGVAPPPDAFVNSPPCSSYFGEKLASTVPPAFGVVQPYATCGYVPAQLRGAYGVDKIGVDGSGVRVAILDAYAAPTIASDANTYAIKHGGRAFSGGQFTQITPAAYQYGYEDTVNGDLCGENGWYGEETLDVEAVHGVAPKANVVYVGAASCFDSDLLDGLNTVVDGHKADIISNSWGETGEPDPVADAAVLLAYKQVFIQAALEGIGVFFSSGDYGDEVAHSGVRSADFPATSPWVTAVGGTSLAVGAKSNYQFEAAWGTGRSNLVAGAWTPAPPGYYVYGAGGGTSRTFAQPWYQKGVVPSAISQYFGGKPGRAEPDIAAIGDPNTGFLVGQTQTFPDGSVKYSEYRIGGTSLSSPVLAGIEALADQAAGEPHGFANPAIYELSGTRGVRDVQLLGKPQGVVRVDYINSVDATGGLRTSFRSFERFGSLTERRGYDDVTGVGSPNGFLYVYGLGQTHNRADAYATAKAG